MEFTSDSAKQFLLSKLVEQASHDDVELDDVEKRMFLFSESSGSTDFEAQEKFDSGYDTRAYESKVAKLLKRSYAHDKKVNESTSWKGALDALSHEDFYGLVMVDQAKIPRSRAALWAFAFKIVPFVLAESAVVGVGFLLVFRPSVFHIHLPDWFRLLLLPVFFWLFWYVGKILGRIRTAKSLPSQIEQR
jgi:hypothetical protein